MTRQRICLLSLFTQNTITSILTSLGGGQRDESIDIVFRQSGEDSSANQTSCGRVKNIIFKSDMMLVLRNVIEKDTNIISL